MKNLILVVAIAIILGSCGSSDIGELYGVQNRPQNWEQPLPYGMTYIPAGSYNMGPADQDVPYNMISKSRTVTVDPFYMDETEITNNEYRQFVYWVRDSLAHVILGVIGSDPDAHYIKADRRGNQFDPLMNPRTYAPDFFFINWKTPIDWNGKDDPANKTALESMYLPERERFHFVKEFDTRKLIYDFYWIDLKKASEKQNRYRYVRVQVPGMGESYIIDTTYANGGGYDKSIGIIDRTSFVVHDQVQVYPDTLCWVHDFTYSYNDNMTKMYFWHPAYDNYPVVGVNWKQAKAFCIWRTDLLNGYLSHNGEAFYNDFRLPSESEWEWAARGGLDLNPLPTGGPYLKDIKGCYIANFKNLRGNYVDDGANKTCIVGHYMPNDYGLYDMAGNVSEWTSNAYDESMIDFGHDINMDYTYNAKESDQDVLKRKSIRGGSWKDISYYLQVSSRSYEYQDTAKSYIGFRCVQSYLGNSQNPNLKSSNYYQ